MMEKTAFLCEINEQPDALRAIASYYRDDEGAERLVKAVELMKSADSIILSGMGTSFYAAYLFERETCGAGPVITCADAGELFHFGMDRFDSATLLIAISQSGESAETKSLTNAAAEKCPVITIVNDETSSMAQAADLVLPLRAGEESAISAKTYTNTIALLLLLAWANNNRSTTALCDSIENEAAIMERKLPLLRKQAQQMASRFTDSVFLHLIARGTDLVTARQWALIMKEGAGQFSEALSAGMFRHGPFELAGKSHDAIFIISGPNQPALTAGLARECADHGSRVMLLTDSLRDQLPREDQILVETGAQSLFSIASAPLIELFVHELAETRGREAGDFQHISKITDRE